MHTTFEEVYNYLVKEPRFRERRLKYNGIARLLIRRYNINEIDPHLLADMIRDANMMDRAWRKALEKNPSLRGTDYNKKMEYESSVQKQLGYKIPGSTNSTI